MKSSKTEKISVILLNNVSKLALSIENQQQDIKKKAFLRHFTTENDNY